MTTNVHFINAGPNPVILQTESAGLDGTPKPNGPSIRVEVGGHCKQYVHSGQTIRVIEVPQ